MIVGNIRWGKERWRVIGVYVGGGDRGLRRYEGLRSGREEKRRKVLVGGDFNARTGRERGRVEKEEGEGWGGRQSKDRKMNREERKLVDFVREGSVFNGNIKGDESEKFTFTWGKGNTVIDYVMGSMEVRDRIIEMWVGNKMDSDHHPLEVRIR